MDLPFRAKVSTRLFDRFAFRALTKDLSFGRGKVDSVLEITSTFKGFIYS